MKKKILTYLILIGLLFACLVLTGSGCSHSTATKPAHSDFYPGWEYKSP